MENLIGKGSESLRKIALNENLKNYILNEPKLYLILKKAANRYIAGETAADAIKTIRELTNEGFRVTSDFMGENTRTAKKAIDATNEFIHFLKITSKLKVTSSISLDLSHIGMMVDKELTIENLQTLCREALKNQTEVIISMEGSDRTDKIIDIYNKVSKNHANLGITLQAYLYRTKDDLKEIIKTPGPVRIVKGAYHTPKELSLPRGVQLNTAYLDYVEQLMIAEKFCAIATHDSYIQQESIKLVKMYKSTNYTLESLYGINNKELLKYQQNGYNCRIYLVYGREWFLYLCNRWAENPFDLFQGLADMIKED